MNGRAVTALTELRKWKHKCQWREKAARSKAYSTSMPGKAQDGEQPDSSESKNEAERGTMKVSLRKELDPPSPPAHSPCKFSPHLAEDGERIS